MTDDKLLSMKELANLLGRDIKYVWHMKRKGFSMAGGRATLGEARTFLAKCPKPCKDSAKRSKS